MSATRDKTQKITFVYSNFYNLYRKGKEAASNAEVPATTPMGLTTSQVLKADSAAAQSAVTPKSLKESVQISEYRAPELIGRRLPNPMIRAVPAAPAPAPAEQVELRAKAVLEQPVSLTGYQPILGKDAEALMSLRGNLEQLNQLHSRLRFMLQELEDLVKE